VEGRGPGLIEALSQPLLGRTEETYLPTFCIEHDLQGPHVHFSLSKSLYKVLGRMHQTVFCG
jgi:hypothetical protein